MTLRALGNPGAGARVVALVLWWVVASAFGCLLLDSKAAAQTDVAPDAFRAGAQPEFALQSISEASGLSDQPDAAFEAIRCNLMTTLEALRKSKGAGAASDGGAVEALMTTNAAPAVPVVCQPSGAGQADATPEVPAGRAAGRMQVGWTLTEEDIGSIQAGLTATLATLQQLKQKDATAGSPPNKPTERATGKTSAGGSTAVAGPPREEITTPPGEGSAPAKIAEMEDRPISSLTTNIQYSKGEVPPDLSGTRFARREEAPFAAFAVRPWAGISYEWAAPGLCHGPLYFEEANLERYGYAHRRNWIFQPVVSGGRFVATVVALPYMVALHPPHECVYTLGYDRPGSCVPFQARLMELNAMAAGAEAAAVTGLIFAIP